ncbi:MAG TPA: CoB--CoM heterodisulfide reductase iron-sulfur subunit B family protein [Dissulfurispiraceae bacterium]|jgi:heterodisulfide reductase subunit B2|nr:CoB--CoM heterodisulfide reductase iron-sulfur subunit B family protein [Dissulfurispiraceae bacterium]
MEIAYYPGCSLHASSEMYDLQSKLVFKKLGIELKEIDDWNCCGATSASKTNEFLAVALPARNLGIADASGLSEILIPCSSCYSRMLVSQKRLAEDQGLKNVINAELAKKVQGNVKIRSIVELLVNKTKSKDFGDVVTKKLEGLKPACYYGCLLTRFPGDIAIPDNVENPQGMENVCKALGAQPVEWSYKTDCCGASASVNDGDVSLFLMSKIMKDAIGRGANCFVVTCPMCQLNLDMYQNDVVNKHGIQQKLPVYFITELVGLAMGLSPSQMHVDRHFVESVRLLKELNLV